MQSIGTFLVAASLFQLFPGDFSLLEQRYHRTESEMTQLVPTGKLHTVTEMRDYPVKVDKDSLGIVTTAKSVIVTDAESGMVLLAEQPDQVRPMGSVTKLMTAMVFLDTDPDLSQVVDLRMSDLVTGGRIYLWFNDGLLLEEVLGAAMVGSDNTAANALIRFSGYTFDEFLVKMNEKAEELGMSNTYFADATGIDAQNMSSARDIVRLLEAAVEYEEIAKYTVQPSLAIMQRSGRSIFMENTSSLTSSYMNEGLYKVKVGKTGYLPQAGYVLASTVQYGDERKAVHVVVLGSETKESRVNEVKGLAAWAFKVFQWPHE